MLLAFSFFIIQLGFSQTVETPVISYVTINSTTNNPTIYWQVNQPENIAGYYIKRYIYSCTNYNPNWHTIATINNGYQLNYQDNFSICPANSSIRAEKYSVRAYNIISGDTILSELSNYHQTIFLEISYNYCKKANTLKWTKYIGWELLLNKYEIYCKKENGVFTKIGTTTINDTSFTHFNVENNQFYSYYIKAIRSDNVESKSNITKIFTQGINKPTYLKTDSLIVNNDINLFFNVDINSDTKRYILYKSENKFGTYDSINGVKNDKENIIFKDIYDNKKNYYYLTAVDYCDDIIFRTDTISNIELKVKKKSITDKINSLDWSGDENLEYKIYRCNNKCEEINTSYNLYYYDDLTSIFEKQFKEEITNGKFCYYITNQSNSFKNKSNTECVIYDAVYFMPNAFNPKSNIEENRTFKPKIAFIKDYELIIYGTFGDIIFSTKNPNIGWDGNLPNNNIAPIASYMYFLKFTNSSGEKIIKKGIVSLVY